ncbi:TPA: InlB B-repeat-containing protein [bacterium]|nr:InlB B-repeat-containing protein [bacterium]
MNRKLKSFMLFVILGVSSLIVSSCDWFGGGKTSSSTTSSETSSESSSEVISSDSTSSDSTSSVDSSSVVIEVFTVTFDTDGGDLVDPQEVNKGEKATEPTTPTKDGYYFVEWQLNGQKFDFNTPITEDITLKAIWDNYKITIFLDKVTLRNYTMTLSGTQRMVMGDVDLIFDYHQLMKVDAVDEVIYLYQESSNPLC